MGRGNLRLEAVPGANGACLIQLLLTAWVDGFGAAVANEVGRLQSALNAPPMPTTSMKNRCSSPSMPRNPSMMNSSMTTQTLTNPRDRPRHPVSGNDRSPDPQRNSQPADPPHIRSCTHA